MQTQKIAGSAIQIATKTPPKQRHARAGGFTLIELMMTVGLLATVLGLGVPSLQSFLVRNQAAAVSTEFASDVARARIEAVSRNGCATICRSANTASAISGGTPTCATTGTNWQDGWIIFSNPSCSATQNDPTTVGSTLVAVRQTGNPNFELTPGGTTTRLTFDSRGIAMGANEKMTLRYVPEDATSPHYRTLCIGFSGRVSINKYLGSTACP